MPTIYDVARKAGVSITTVSRVINDHSTVRKATRQRVEEAMRDLEYIPNASARSLTLRSSRIIALVVPDISNPFYSELARGAQDVCDKAAYSLLISSTDGDPAKERTVLERLCHQQIDGICLVRHLVDESNLSLLVNRKLPLVLIGSLPTSFTLDTIGTYGTGRAMDAIVQSLWESGLRRLGHVTGHDHTAVGLMRLKYYRSLVERFGLDVDPELVVTAEFNREGGRRATERLLALATPPDMIFCSNDLMATGALEAAEHAGIRVPDQLAVFGCDDIDIAALLRPSLTTIHLPKYELGHQGAELLLERIASPDMPVRQRALQVSPVFRTSTAVKAVV